MNQPSHSAVTLSSLVAVDWKSDFMISLGYARSRARLMREYLRRAAWWAQELDATDKWPFFDIGGLLTPEVHAGIPLPPQLEDPFEPLLLMFERGGGFTTEAGFIDLGGSSVLQKTWRGHLSTQPIVSLDQATLDALDEPKKSARPEQPS